MSTVANDRAKIQAQFIRHHRNNPETSVRDLAELLGVSKSTVSRWMRVYANRPIECSISMTLTPREKEYVEDLARMRGQSSSSFVKKCLFEYLKTIK